MNIKNLYTNEVNLVKREYSDLKNKFKSFDSKKANWKKINTRMLMFFFSIPLFAMSAAILKAVAMLGLNPNESMWNSFSEITSLTYGQWLVIAAVFFAIFGSLVSKTKIMDSLSLVSGLLMNFIIDPFIALLYDPIQSFIGLTEVDSTLDWISSWQAWIIFFAGFTLQVFAISLWITAEFALRPLDLFIKRISERSGKKYGNIWIIWSAISATVSLILFATITKVPLTLGIGSIVLMFITGHLVAFIYNNLKKLVNQL